MPYSGAVNAQMQPVVVFQVFRNRRDTCERITETRGRWKP
jgi:hypothetical protein